MLSIRASVSNPASGLSDPEKITLYIVAAVAVVMSLLGITIAILRTRHLQARRQQACARFISMVKNLPIIQYGDSDSDAYEKCCDMETALRNSTCPICTEDFVQGQLLHVLPCRHQYHMECIQGWLSRGSRCPICRVDLKSPMHEKLKDKVDIEQGLQDGRARSGQKRVHRVLRFLHDLGLGQHYNSA